MRTGQPRTQSEHFLLSAFYRLELLTGKNQTASDRLSQSEDRRQDIETQFETTGEKIEHLERQVAAAKEIAEEIPEESDGSG